MLALHVRVMAHPTIRDLTMADTLIRLMTSETPQRMPARRPAHAPPAVDRDAAALPRADIG